MDPKRWEQVQDLLLELEPLSPDERAALLDERCADDLSLRREVESLLAVSSDAASYFDDLSDRTGRMGDAPREPRPSLVGQRVEQFEVVEKLGEGGMGEVYRATDTQLRRDVALKVLTERLARDQRQVARFRREAQILASLNHPGIGQIFGLTEAGGRTVLVLELVDGPTLSHVVAARPVPVDDALDIALQIANALEAAHLVGVIHRDLKPANVKLTEGGRVKVLDFGIAKPVREHVSTRSDETPSTTEILARTNTGQIVGTVFYMSPEQLKGKPVDVRSDVWAFGTVLFEMLAGRRPFQGESFAESLAQVLEHDPSWTALPADTPPALRYLLRRCLTRDVNKRLQSIGEARIILESVQAGEDGPWTAAEAVASPSSVWPRRARVIGAAAVLAAVAFFGGSWFANRPSGFSHSVQRYVSPFRAGQEPVLFGTGAFGLTSDGETVIYRGPAGDGTGNRLWVRSWDTVSASPIEGTEGAVGPAISYDGRQLAFSQNGQIKLLPLAGGPTRTLLRGLNPVWGRDGSLYVTTRDGTARIPPGGGDPIPVTVREEGGGNHFLIDILPDGRRGLLSIDHPEDESEILVVDLEDGTMRSVRQGGWPRYLSSGHIVFLFNGALLAAPFDAASGAMLGEAELILNGVISYALADDGTLAYAGDPAAAGRRSELVWVDRRGNATPVESGWHFNRGGSNPGWSLSPDGSRIALRITTDAGHDIWVKDLNGGAPSRLTFHGAEDRKPRWSPDGSRVLFLSDRRGPLDVWQKPADGTGEATLVFGDDSRIAEARWSGDESWLLMRVAGAQDLAGGREIVGFRPGVDSAAVPLITGPFDQIGPVLSPDGAWLAYASNETGRYEVYVSSFPVGGGRWQVTTDGGTTPEWAHSGEELFYIDGARRMVSMRFSTSAGFRPTDTQVLFTIPPGYDLAQVASLFDPSPDDSRFLMARSYGGDAEALAAGPEFVLVRGFPTLVRAQFGG